MARADDGAGRPGLPRPTPRALGGSTDPARRVRPVDWSAGAGRPAAEPGSPAGAEPGRGDGAAALPARSPAAKRPRTRARTVELPRPVPAPPVGAVHSLSAADPRPLPRPLRIEDEDIRTVGVHGLSAEQIVQTVADPEDAWTADAGASDHFLRAEAVVQVRRSDNAVIGLFSTRYALSVRPAEYEPALDIAEEAAGPSARGGRGTRHPTSRRELLGRMEAEGFVVTPGATHGRVSHPDHPGLVLPFASTPSDRRFTRHAVAQIRRVFGIDLRR
ncbi:hypothetical protein CFK38_00880 [Brachybacterium vulturis]|uniref:Uncharacterized protein n=1 Tax=Brachybacterium vulturis TaxID=2017484 RepID=A0A291GI62_9MICO|nr:hypothetical protein [Brachybacterium vulturis]ATG50233.1 hypothetical protein CFK38_00880 [Brachybacterium vulturis]